MKRLGWLALSLSFLLAACTPARTPPPTQAPGAATRLPAAAQLESTPVQMQTPAKQLSTAAYLQAPGAFATVTAILPTPTPLQMTAWMDLQGTPFPQPAEAIGPENAARVTGLARWGNGKINELALSPDGQTIAAATSLGIYLYAEDTLEPRGAFHTPTSLNALAFSPDGKTLASGSDEGVLLWDLATGRILSAMGGNGHDWVNAVAFSPDGRILASGTNYATIDLWDPTSGSLMKVLSWDPYYWTDALAFSPDGEFLASGQRDSGGKRGVILLWDLATGKVENQCGDRVRTPWVDSLAISPDGKTIAFGSDEVSVLMWDIAQNQVTQTLDPDASWIYSLAYSPDGRSLAVGTIEGNLFILDTATGKTLNTRQLQSGAIASLVFSADGRRLYTASGEGLQVWDAASGALLESKPEHMPSGILLSFFQTGTRLATVTRSAVTVWDAFTGSRLQSFEGENFAAISPDGASVAAAAVGDRLTLLLYDLASGKVIHKLSHGVGGNIAEMAFSPDGRVLAQVEYSNEKVLLLWDAGSGRLLHSLQGETAFSGELAFSPDGKTLAVTGGVSADAPRGQVGFWDVASGSKIQTLQTGDGGISAMAFSADGSRLAAQIGASVSLWDPESGDLLLVIDHKFTSNRKLALSPDARILAVGGWSGDPAITLWETATGAQMVALTGHSLDTTGLAFSPDGARLASSGEDGVLLIWGVSPSQLAASPTESPAFSPANPPVPAASAQEPTLTGETVSTLIQSVKIVSQVNVAGSKLELWLEFTFKPGDILPGSEIETALNQGALELTLPSGEKKTYAGVPHSPADEELSSDLILPEAVAVQWSKPPAGILPLNGMSFENYSNNLSGPRFRIPLETLPDLAPISQCQIYWRSGSLSSNAMTFDWDGSKITVSNP